DHILVGATLAIDMGNGGLNGMEAITLQDVASSDLFINVSSNLGDIVEMTLTNVSVIDTAPVCSFALRDNGAASGGTDFVIMDHVAVAQNMAMSFTEASNNCLSAAHVTCAFGEVLGVSDFADGGGNQGWYLVGHPV